MTPRSEHWPFEPVEAELRRRCASYAQGSLSYGMNLLAVVSQRNEAQCWRWRKQGYLTDRMADHVAVALGRHPSFFWPTWFDVAGNQVRP